MKAYTEPLRSKSGFGYTSATDKMCSPLDAIQERESECPCHGPRERCLCHQATAGNWALSQLTGLSGGQRLAAAPRAGPSGWAETKAGEVARLTCPPACSGEKQRASISITVGVQHLSPAETHSDGCGDGAGRRCELDNHKSHSVLEVATYS